MQTYHDTEWGIALHDNRALWETLMLEGFQAGLSWLIVLRKREAFRKAFAGFDPYKVARFGDKQIAALMNNEGIIRSRAKIDATIQGARIYCEMEKRGEHFADYCWSFTDNKIVHGDGATFPTSTALSERVSKDLKSRGFKFCGPTITYAWLQAVGIVNDHATHCAFRHRANHKDSKKERTTGGKLVTKHQGEPTSGPGQSGDASMPTDIS
jgi:DNA-3-methyladenine glycosylase I